MMVDEKDVVLVRANRGNHGNDAFPQFFLLLSCFHFFFFSIFVSVTDVFRFLRALFFFTRISSAL